MYIPSPASCCVPSPVTSRPRPCSQPPILPNLPPKKATLGSAAPVLVVPAAAPQRYRPRNSLQTLTRLLAVAASTPPTVPPAVPLCPCRHSACSSPSTLALLPPRVESEIDIAFHADTALSFALERILHVLQLLAQRAQLCCRRIDGRLECLCPRSAVFQLLALDSDYCGR